MQSMRLILSIGSVARMVPGEIIVKLGAWMGTKALKMRIAFSPALSPPPSDMRFDGMESGAGGFSRLSTLLGDTGSILGALKGMGSLVDAAICLHIYSAGLMYTTSSGAFLSQHHLHCPVASCFSSALNTPRRLLAFLRPVSQRPKPHHNESPSSFSSPLTFPIRALILIH